MLSDLSAIRGRVERLATGTLTACGGQHEFSHMSVWREGSDVLRINAAAGERPVAVSPEVREVLHAARRISEWTNGKFDVTFGALADVWKFDAQNQDNTVPDEASIRARAGSPIAAHAWP